MVNKIPVSVVIATKNEEKNIARCLKSAKGFAEIVVVDSNSTDRTQEIAREMGARVENFNWDGKYPKKRQWVLNSVQLSQGWVFWLDADEELTPECRAEMEWIFSMDLAEAGFFVRGRYIWRGQMLRHGMMNNKIALMNRHKMEFPLVDDLHIEGMGEIEGHYQPVLKAAFKQAPIGQVGAPLLHFAYEDEAAWQRRHARYAHWEAEMTRQESWPSDPVRLRETAKRVIRTSVFRPYIMFLYSYVWRGGFLDGRAGLAFALSRKRYCDMILKMLNNLKAK